MYPTTCIRLQGPCLVPALKGPTPNPSLRREGNNHPRRERGNPKNVSDDVHPLAGAVPRAGPKTMFDRFFNHPQLGEC